MSFHYDLTVLNSQKNLISFLEINEKDFERVLAFVPDEKPHDAGPFERVVTISIPLFIRHEIPKKNSKRGIRIVWEPTFLKRNYKALGRRLNSFFAHAVRGFPHPRTFGYIGGRNIRENAWDHRGHTNLISIDLKDFFPSIKAGRISGFLVSTGIEPTVAELLSRFVTIGGALPLGLPTSPTIANAICTPLDFEMDALAQKYQATFSRYADDITFSSNATLPPFEEMTACVRAHGFDIAESKTRRSRRGQAHYVTGLSISDPIQPHVPRGRKHKLRQELYYAEKFGLRDHLHHLGINHERHQHEINRLDGLVKFTAYHEPRLRARLRTAWDEILQESGDSPSFEPKNFDRAPFHIYIDEAEYSRPDGVTILALAMAVSQYQDQIDVAAEEVLNAELSDLWAEGKRKVLQKEGLHFSQVTISLRKSYVEKMRSLPFEAYVAMAPLDPAHYEETYIKLLSSMITRRLMAAESQAAFFVFEKNDKVSQTAISDVISEAFVRLECKNSRRPRMYTVKFTGKPNFGLSTPDFLLGVLGRYLAIKPRKESQPDLYERMFERLRDKYKLISDLGNAQEYSRRRDIKPWDASG